MNFRYLPKVAQVVSKVGRTLEDEQIGGNERKAELVLGPGGLEILDEQPSRESKRQLQIKI